MRSLLKSPFPRLIVFKKKRKHSLSLSLSASTFFADPLISEKRSWREKGRGKKKRSKARKRVTFYRDVYGDVCSSRFSVNSGRAALFVSLPLFLYIYMCISLSLVGGESVGPQESRAARAAKHGRNNPRGNAIPANVSTWTLPPSLFSRNFSRQT